MSVIQGSCFLTFVFKCILFFILYDIVINYIYKMVMCFIMSNYLSDDFASNLARKFIQMHFELHCDTAMLSLSLIGLMPVQ